MGSPEEYEAWAPDWVETLGVAVWVSGPDRTIRYVNGKGETLLGASAHACIGVPCYELIHGLTERAETHCGPDCSVVRMAQANREIEPALVQLPNPHGDPRWVLLLVCAVDGPDGRYPWLVHCALAMDSTHRIVDYIRRVASRSLPSGRGQDHAVPDLTERETQILDLLAGDLTLQTIATELNLSYVTVRNHVQHILRKLGVHSIMEAVAQHLTLRS